MSMYRKLLAGLLVGALMGCASTSLVNMWMDPTYDQPPMKSMLVVAMKKDPARRRIMEDALALELAKHGVTTMPSYRLFPNEAPDTAEVADAVAKNGYDGVVVASPLPTERNAVYVPGYSTIESRPVYNWWSGRYHTQYIRVHHPGYVEPERVVRHQIDVWSTGSGGALIWTAVGEQIDPNSANQVSHEIADKVVPELVRKHLIPG